MVLKNLAEYHGVSYALRLEMGKDAFESKYSSILHEVLYVQTASTQQFQAIYSSSVSNAILFLEKVQNIYVFKTILFLIYWLCWLTFSVSRPKSFLKNPEWFPNSMNTRMGRLSKKFADWPDPKVHIWFKLLIMETVGTITCCFIGIP